jgi:nucleoside 2-deoxyribosyltransferase
MPGGKSAHLELGYMIGQGKPCYVFFDKEPERWDVMYQFAKDVFFSKEELLAELKKIKSEDTE